MEDRQENHRKRDIMRKEDGKLIRLNEFLNKRNLKRKNVIEIPNDTPALTNRLAEEAVKSIRDYWIRRSSSASEMGRGKGG